MTVEIGLPLCIKRALDWKEIRDRGWWPDDAVAVLSLIRADFFTATCPSLDDLRDANTDFPLKSRSAERAFERLSKVATELSPNSGSALLGSVCLEMRFEEIETHLDIPSRSCKILVAEGVWQARRIYDEQLRKRVR